MSKQTSKSFKYGDHGFRADYAGRDPGEIRRELAARARAEIARSIGAGISVKNAVSDWPWLHRLRSA